jgi:hypothetical protein
MMPAAMLGEPRRVGLGPFRDMDGSKAPLS